MFSLSTIVLSLAGLTILLFAVNLVWTIDDWSRDLTTNFAATSEDAKMPELHPIHSTKSAEQLQEIVIAVAKELPRWELVEQKESAGSMQLHFVRTTMLMRFKDDIRVTIAPADGDGSLLTAESQSRVGKGDLGQNPRNLLELLAGVRKRLE
jgi:uncharacterized protein (DUF1499 family)